MRLTRICSIAIAVLFLLNGVAFAWASSGVARRSMVQAQLVAEANLSTAMIWEAFIVHAPKEDRLWEIIRDAREQFKELAFAEVMKRKSKGTLGWCVLYAPEPYKRRAWDFMKSAQLLDQETVRGFLCDVDDEQYRKKFAEEILAYGDKIEVESFQEMAMHAPEPFAGTAWKALSALVPSDEKLDSLGKFLWAGAPPMYGALAWQEISKVKLTPKQIAQLLEDGGYGFLHEEYRQKLWDMLFSVPIIDLDTTMFKTLDENADATQTQLLLQKKKLSGMKADELIELMKSIAGKKP